MSTNGNTFVVRIELRDTNRDAKTPAEVPNKEKSISPWTPNTKPIKTTDSVEHVRMLVVLPRIRKVKMTLKTSDRHLATLSKVYSINQRDRDIILTERDLYIL